MAAQLGEPERFNEFWALLGKAFHRKLQATGKASVTRGVAAKTAKVSKREIVSDRVRLKEVMQPLGERAVNLMAT